MNLGEIDGMLLRYISPSSDILYLDCQVPLKVPLKMGGYEKKNKCEFLLLC